MEEEIEEIELNPIEEEATIIEEIEEVDFDETIGIDEDENEYEDEDDYTQEHEEIIEDIKMMESDLRELQISKELVLKQIELHQATKVQEEELEQLSEKLEELEKDEE